jgi:GT2 family glycosyltransferase
VKAAVVIPTRDRAAYLDVALRSIVGQAQAAGAEIVVVDDGGDADTEAVARRHGARYLSHDRPRGLNAARNTAIAHTDAELLCFVDDDVEVADGWLAALLSAAARSSNDVGVFTGPIRARFEGHRFRMCGREDAPITTLYLGDGDTDAPHAWGANMAVRRGAIDRVGPFDETRELYGDEQEWQARWRAARGRIRYVAAAALDHRRAGDDARLRSLMRAAYRRGQASRRFDAFKGTAPPVTAELSLVARTALHGPRFRCASGPVMCAHSLGRLRAALAPPVGDPPAEDFLSGASGTVAGKRGTLLAVEDRIADLRSAPTVRRERRKARTQPPRRTVLAVGVDRVGGPGLMAAAVAELHRSRHAVEVRTTPGIDGFGKFENLATLVPAPPDADWLIVLDDDILLPHGFLDTFLEVAERLALRIAQPAHRLHSNASWSELKRHPGVAGRETTFVEIGPLTAFARETFATLLPLPSLRMGWGLDAHWSAVAREHDWAIGVVDATPMLHTRPSAGAYGHDEAIAEARRFLAQRPYVTRDEVRTVAVHR